MAGMEEPVARKLLEHCPRCRYALEGLPEEHRCPECGLGIDRQWHVFGGRAVWHTNMRALVVFTLGILVLGAVLSAAMLILKGDSSILGWSGAGLYVFVLIPLLAWFFVARPAGFVGVGPRGVAVYRGRGKVEEFGWDRIGKARFHLKSLISKSLELVIDDKPKSFPGFHIFRGNIAEIEACIRCINRYPQDRARSRYGKPSPKYQRGAP